MGGFSPTVAMRSESYARRQEQPRRFLITISTMPATPPVVLSIAGYDPSSGAGITADVKTIAAHGCYAITCITALTVQSTQGVRSTEPVRAEIVRQTLEELAADFEIAAVRVGMLGFGDAIRSVAE